LCQPLVLTEFPDGFAQIHVYSICATAAIARIAARNSIA
jgi:hypothetical protein